MEVMYSFILLLIVDLLFCYYFSKKVHEEHKKFFLKFKALFLLDKHDYIIIAVMSLCAVTAFCIDRFIYSADLLMALRWQLAVMLMIPIAVIDFKEKIIPNKILLIGLIFTVCLICVQVVSQPEYLLNIVGTSLIGALMSGGIFLIASLIVKGGIGAGDIKLFFVLGLLLAFEGIFNVLLYSMILSAVFGILLLILKKKKYKDTLPLAPFALAGVILSIAFGV